MVRNRQLPVDQFCRIFTDGFIGDADRLGQSAISRDDVLSFHAYSARLLLSASRKALTKPEPMPPDAPVTIAVFFPDMYIRRLRGGSKQSVKGRE